MMRFFPMRRASSDLAQAVVDLVRARVQQVFALQINPRAAQLFGQPLCKIKWRRASRIVVQQFVQFRLKRRIFARVMKRPLQLFERRHQHFGDVAPAVGSEVAAGIRLRGHEPNAALRNCAILP